MWDILTPSHKAASLTHSLHPSPVAPMEDLGTLKEQHREQKLFPQLLQLRCGRETTVSDGAHPQAPDTQDLFPPSTSFSKMEVGPQWGGSETGQNSSRG